MKTTLDDREVMRFLRSAPLTADDLLDIEKPAALTVINKQRQLVPVDTSLTKNSIGQHIDTATDTEVIDEIGPETTYAPSIEFGVTSKPNYPIQPFVRPSAFGNENNIARAALTAFAAKVREKYG